MGDQIKLHSGIGAIDFEDNNDTPKTEFLLNVIL